MGKQKGQTHVVGTTNESTIWNNTNSIIFLEATNEDNTAVWLQNK